MGQTEGSLLDVGEVDYPEYTLSDDLQWFRTRIERFIKGGIYLVAGQPGIGKSTLGIQLALDMGRNGLSSVYIMNEQSKEDLNNRANLITSKWTSADRKKAFGNLFPYDDSLDIENLPGFLTNYVLSRKGRFHNVSMIVVDSVQGQGLSAASTTKYRKVYEFCRQCKSNGITAVLVAHVTKRGEIAGPKDLEHNVDCVIVMRKALIYRPMFVPKNRFGPAVLKPVPLMMNSSTALQLSPHSSAQSASARTFIGGDQPVAEIQAAVSLPSYGSRGRIVATGLPQKEIEQITNCIAQLPDLDIDDLDFTIHCRIPEEKSYRSVLGLPLAMSLISSYLQLEIPQHYLYLGEIDLFRQVRPLRDQVLVDLVDAIERDLLTGPIRLIMAPQSAEQLQSMFKEDKRTITVVPCAKLDDALHQTWPDLKNR